jgi:hypothetical protein
MGEYEIMFKRIKQTDSMKTEERGGKGRERKDECGCVCEKERECVKKRIS